MFEVGKLIYLDSSTLLLQLFFQGFRGFLTHEIVNEYSSRNVYFVKDISLCLFRRALIDKITCSSFVLVVKKMYVFWNLHLIGSLIKSISFDLYIIYFDWNFWKIWLESYIPAMIEILMLTTAVVEGMWYLTTSAWPLRVLCLLKSMIVA